MPTDTNSLIEDSKCIDQCVPRGMQQSVLIVLLAKIAGVSDDPNTLIEMAKCVDCQVPEGIKGSVILSLFYKIYAAGTTEPCTNLITSTEYSRHYGPTYASATLVGLTDGSSYTITFGASEIELINGANTITSPGAGQTVAFVASNPVNLIGSSVGVPITAVICEA
jgi:hypothetical protein